MPAVDFSKSRSLELNSPAQGLSPDISDWTDQEFCESFESLRIPNELFRHREHIRLAWIYLTCFSEKEAASRMVQAIRAFAKHHGAEAKYHHTITLAWMHLVAHEVRCSPAGQHFSSFLIANPHLLDQRLLAEYYSSARLKSDAARNGWLEPDRQPLP